MKIIKKFNITDVYGNIKEERTYTLLFGDYVLVKWPDSGSPYWHTRSFAEEKMKLDHNKGAKIVDEGTIYVEETGGYFRDEQEFLSAMRMLRGKLKE